MLKNRKPSATSCPCTCCTGCTALGLWRRSRLKRPNNRNLCAISAPIGDNWNLREYNKNCMWIQNTIFCLFNFIFYFKRKILHEYKFFNKKKNVHVNTKFPIKTQTTNFPIKMQPKKFLRPFFRNLNFLLFLSVCCRFHKVHVKTRNSKK